MAALDLACDQVTTAPAALLAEEVGIIALTPAGWRLGAISAERLRAPQVDEPLDVRGSF
jgi:hypothetical protein